MAKRVLILGGTTEGLQVAELLADHPDFEPITSLAGRTSDPEMPPGASRIGGFGGAEGLAGYLAKQSIHALIDASHPFAEQISRNGIEASRLTGVPMLRLERSAWRRCPHDNWIDVADAEAAAGKIVGLARRVFLSIGRQHLAPFGRLSGVWFLLRMIDPPDAPLPIPDPELILGRGPFNVDDEVGLLSNHRIDAVVSRNSGGSATYGKIVAAQRLGLPVIMIQRPKRLPGERVSHPWAAVEWLEAHSSGPIGDRVKE